MKLRIAAVVALAFMLGGLAGIYAPGLWAVDERETLREELNEDFPELKDASRAFKKIARLISPSIVHVVVQREAVEEDFGLPLFQFLFSPGAPRESEQESQATGVFFSSDGIIVTNNHVVQGATSITVTTIDGNMYPADVVGTDPKTDLAVLRIDAPDCIPAPLGNDEDIQIGDWAVAFGNPFGLTLTVTAGIISAKGRANVGIADYEDFIQTDAAINPGNSGGALCNIRGELIGINTAILSESGGYQGIGFAIPITMVSNVVEQILAHGKVVRGWIGVEIRTLAPWETEGLGIEGFAIRLEGLADDGPALVAGLQKGDLLLALDGRTLHDSQQLRNTISLSPVGQDVRFLVMRGGNELVVPVRVESLDDAVKRRQAPLGFTARSINEDDQRQLGLMGQSGTLLIKVEPGSLAATAGLREGDLVVEVDGQPVAELADLERLLAEANPEAGIDLVIRRGFSRYRTVIRTP